MLILNRKNIYLLDGIGALMSLSLTGLILPYFSTLLGLSEKTLYFLACFPLIYCGFSLSCYFFVKNFKRWMIKTIIFANGLYCLVSGAIIFSLPDIKIWGILLLISEIIVVAFVIAVEVYVLQNYYRE
jgi:hypothetical protein